LRERERGYQFCQEEVEIAGDERINERGARSVLALLLMGQ